MVYSNLGKMSDKPYALGERPGGGDIPTIPLLSGKAAWDSLTPYYTPRRLDSRLRAPGTCGPVSRPTDHPLNKVAEIMKLAAVKVRKSPAKPRAKITRPNILPLAAPAFVSTSLQQQVGAVPKTSPTRAAKLPPWTQKLISPKVRNTMLGVAAGGSLAAGVGSGMLFDETAANARQPGVTGAPDVAGAPKPDEASSFSMPSMRDVGRWSVPVGAGALGAYGLYRLYKALRGNDNEEEKAASALATRVLEEAPRVAGFLIACGEAELPDEMIADGLVKAAALSDEFAAEMEKVATLGAINPAVPVPDDAWKNDSTPRPVGFKPPPLAPQPVAFDAAKVDAGTIRQQQSLRLERARLTPAQQAKAESTGQAAAPGYWDEVGQSSGFGLWGKNRPSHDWTDTLLRGGARLGTGLAATGIGGLTGAAAGLLPAITVGGPAVGGTAIAGGLLSTGTTGTFLGQNVHDANKAKAEGLKEMTDEQRRQKKVQDASIVAADTLPPDIKAKYEADAQTNEPIAARQSRAAAFPIGTNEGDRAVRAARASLAEEAMQTAREGGWAPAVPGAPGAPAAPAALAAPGAPAAPTAPGAAPAAPSTPAAPAAPATPAAAGAPAAAEKPLAPATEQHAQELTAFKAMPPEQQKQKVTEIYGLSKDIVSRIPPDKLAEIYDMGNTGKWSRDQVINQYRSLAGAGVPRDSIGEYWNHMTDGERTALGVGIPLAAIGIISSVFGRGGMMSWLMSLLGLGMAGGAAASSGTFGQGGQDFMGGVMESLGMGGEKPAAPAKPLTPVEQAKAQASMVRAQGTGARLQTQFPEALKPYMAAGDANKFGDDPKGEDISSLIKAWTMNPASVPQMDQIIAAMNPQDRADLTAKLNEPETAAMFSPGVMNFFTDSRPQRAQLLQKLQRG